MLELVVADVIKALIDGGRMDKRMAKQFPTSSQRVDQAPLGARAVGAGVPDWGIFPTLRRHCKETRQYVTID